MHFTHTVHSVHTVYSVYTVHSLSEDPLYMQYSHTEETDTRSLHEDTLYSQCTTSLTHTLHTVYMSIRFTCTTVEAVLMSFTSVKVPIPIKKKLCYKLNSCIHNLP